MPIFCSISNNNIGEIKKELVPGWEQDFEEKVREFDHDTDGTLSDEEMGSFIRALGIEEDIASALEFFKTSGPEADSANLDDRGNMTVEGMVNFYKKAAQGRADAVIGNLGTLGLLKAEGVLVLADAIRVSTSMKSLK